MKILKILLIVLFLVPYISFSQQNSKADVVNVSKITLLNPGLSYEMRIGRLQTLYGQFFIHTLFYSDTLNSVINLPSFYFDPAMTVQYRIYFNAKKREAHAKRIDMNSLNYVSAVSETIFSKAKYKKSSRDEKNRRLVNKFGVVCGLQRNYKRRFSLDINLGLGYLITTQTSTSIYTGQSVKENIGMIAPLGQLNFGIWLNKKK